MTTTTLPQSKILWPQVFALAMVQGAIVLSWVIYNLYLGDLLKQFGFTAGFILGILLLENGLAMLMEPLMGRFSDQAQQWFGSRFPFIAGGVILASFLLITIPVIFIFGSQVGLFRWFLPIVLVAWAISMTLFRSPALSLMGRYAYGSGLPQAVSVLTVVGALAGAMGPLANQFILSLGPAIAFGIASFVLLGAAALLRAVQPEAQIEAPENRQRISSKSSLSVIRLFLIFVVGCGFGVGFRLQMFAFPKILAAIPGIDVKVIMGTIFLTIALTAIPAGSVARKVGNRQSMIIGFIGIILTLGLMNLVHHTVVAFLAAISLGTFLSLVNNGTLPFALSMVPDDKAGVGTGMFFSGGALAANVFGALFKKPDAFAPSILLLVAIAGWSVAMIAIGSSRKLDAPTMTSA